MRPRKPNEVVTHYLEWAEQDGGLRSAAVRLRHAKWLRRWLIYLARRQRTWTQATQADAADWLLEQSALTGVEGLRQAVCMGRKLYGWAIRRRWHPGPNPFARLREPRVRPAPQSPPPGMAALLEPTAPIVPRWHRARAAWGLSVGCRLRRNEIRMLDWPDVDLAQGRVTVRGGKGGTWRVERLPSWVAWLLREYATWAGRTEGPVFRGVRGGRISYDALAVDLLRVARCLSGAASANPLAPRQGVAVQSARGARNLEEGEGCGDGPKRPQPSEQPSVRVDVSGHRRRDPGQRHVGDDR